MQRKPLNISKFLIKPMDLFQNQWVLLTSGDFGKSEFNAMTIGWGALGTMWSKPFAFVAVRFSRFTFQFMEKYETFTLTAFPKEYRDALNLLGTKSGRDGDKIAASGLTPEPAKLVKAPAFKEAELVIECQKMYANDLNPAHFLDEGIYRHYPNRDFHRIYYGEVLHVSGSKKFSA